jgi:hypothetical protein
MFLAFFLSYILGHILRYTLGKFRKHAGRFIVGCNMSNFCTEYSLQNAIIFARTESSLENLLLVSITFLVLWSLRMKNIKNFSLEPPGMSLKNMILGTMDREIFI